jgi:AcrR family transcriptional regulator
MIGLRPQISREFVERHQRERLLHAAAELAARTGVGGITTTRLLAGARMARNTFYDLFAGKDAFLEFAFAEAFAFVFDSVPAALGSPAPWPQRLDEAIAGIYGSAGADPPLAALCLVYSSESPRSHGHDYQTGVDALAALIGEGREAGRRALAGRYRDPPANAEDFLAQGIASLAALRLRQGLGETLPAHTLEMAVLASVPFFGPTAASHFTAGLGAGPGQTG